jgi:hypothetical protein
MVIMVGRSFRHFPEFRLQRHLLTFILLHLPPYRIFLESLPQSVSQYRNLLELQPKSKWVEKKPPWSQTEGSVTNVGNSRLGRLSKAYRHLGAVYYHH